MRSFLFAVLAIAFAGSLAAAAATSLLPAVGASQTFAVATHSDLPFHRPPGGQGNGPGDAGGPPPGGPAPSGSPGANHGQFQQFYRDETGTITLKRASDTSLTVATTGDVDAIDAPLSVNAQGGVDVSQSPNRFMVAFDNASAVAAVPSGGSATFSVLMPDGSTNPVALTVKVLSASGSDTKLEGTGTGTITMSTPHGDRPIDINATADLELSAGRLSAYTQTLVQSVKTPFRTMNITTTTSLKAQ